MVRVRVVVMLVLAGLVFLVGACGSDESEPDSTTAGSLALPDDFPAEVPVIEGAVLAVGGTAKDGWNLTVAGRADAGDPFDNASTQLLDAGYTEQFQRQEGSESVKGFVAESDGKRYTVVIGTTEASVSGPTAITYQVSQT
jgi:hypothetical protein